MAIEIKSGAFDPYRELDRHQSRILSQAGKYGATASFVGTMRDFSDGGPVHSMTLEYYPGMTERHLHQICEEAKQRWDILDSLIVHRIGDIQPNDPIVLVAAWSAHRAAAFDACRYLIEELKTRAPFWKKEQLQEATRWVEHNTPAA